MKTLYLDQNHWIYLGRAAQGRPMKPEHVDALEVIRYGAGNGHLQCPLSAQHYMETLKRKDGVSRRLGKLMYEISNLVTIAPPSQVVPAEIDRALYRRYGKPAVPRELKLFGRGFGFAVGQNDYRFPLSPEDEALMTRARRQEAVVFFTEALERAMLLGPEGGFIPGSNNRLLADFGQRFAQGERDFAGALAAANASTSQAADWIAASELIDIISPLNEALARAGISETESHDLATKDGMSSLLRDLPSRSVVHELRRLRHKNAQTRWAANDLNDLGALSVAIAYSGVVITEK